MTHTEPRTELDARYSSPEAAATPWAEAAKQLGQAQLFWLSTVRPDGRPHVTPLIAVWLGDALHFCTGAHERKAKNLEQNPYVTITTGNNAMSGGLDLVLEGAAARVTDDAALQRIAQAYEAKYGPDWHFDVKDGTFNGQEGNVALVFAVAPTTAFGFGKGAVFSQTRWRFEGRAGQHG